MDQYLIYFSFGVLLVIAGIFYFSYYAGKKRTEAMQAFAVQRGFVFTKKPVLDISRWKIFSKGRSHRVLNMMKGSMSRVDLSIFDFIYRTSTGQSQNVRKQTVAVAGYGNMNCPAFTLDPESFLNRIGELIGIKGIDFDTNPEFSKRYVLRGADDPSIRGYFSPQKLAFFERFEKRPAIEAEAESLVFYYPGTLLKPEDLQKFIDTVIQTVKILSFS